MKTEVKRELLFQTVVSLFVAVFLFSLFLFGIRISARSPGDGEPGLGLGLRSPFRQGKARSATLGGLEGGGTVRTRCEPTAYRIRLLP